MKLKTANSIYNMGDTSIRVKQIVEINKVILKQLYLFNEAGDTWSGNSANQETFYKNFLDEIIRIQFDDGIDLFRDFSRKREHKNDRVGMRGRTLTSSIVKNGFASSDRILSNVGKNYLFNTLTKSDVLESLFMLDMDNLVYLRQYLKLRIYDSEGKYFFYNFRFAIKFLVKYDNVPITDFFKIIESIKPQQSEDELLKIIDDYNNVVTGMESFDDYYARFFSINLRTKEELDKAKRMFEERDFSDSNFMELFPNRDRKKTSLLYKDFVLSIIELHENATSETLSKLYTLSRDDKIKKAFGSGKMPFDIRKKDTIQTFFDKNKGNRLLSLNYYDIYLEFIFSKHNDLIREYSDMSRRAFQVTGLISFDQGLVNLNHKWVLKPLVDILGDRFVLSGCDSYNLYENNLSSEWFQDISSMQILTLTQLDIDELYKQLALEFKLDDVEVISTVIQEKKEADFRQFIETHFPIDKVIRILKLISDRNDENDDKVFNEVTDNATIPTIYEYILTIAWYHISAKKDFKVSTTFQVTLDGNRLPLVHRGGGAGDIEIKTSDYNLLIEATLMNMSTQKRGELEPVIRHSINFCIDNDGEHSQSIFVANELDPNVLNIFRAMQFVTLNGTFDSNRNVAGLNIFAFTTKEVVLLLEKRITDDKILDIINENLDQNPCFIKNGWRDSIVRKLLT